MDLEEQLSGLQEQFFVLQKELNMVEGAVQLTKQMIADAVKEEHEKAPKKKKQSK